jgi:hypothetical protein
LELSVGIRSAGIQIVNKSDVVPDENVVLQSHSFADESMAGDLTPVSDLGSFLNLNERPDLHVITDLTPIEVVNG